jgi:dephospho-CoA kinase
MSKRPKINASSGVIIGLTGGIASGKSNILSCFKKLGFKTYDTDKAVHEMFKKGHKCFDQVSKAFPATATKNKIDRVKLSQIVLKSKIKLKKLESIVHPLVRQDQEDFKKSNVGHSIVFEIPLLFENKREKYFHYVISAIVDKNTQKIRCQRRKGMTDDKLSAILALQVRKDIHYKKADFLINTSGRKSETFRKIKELISDE